MSLKPSSVVLQKTKIYLVSHISFGPLSCLDHIFCKLLFLKGKKKDTTLRLIIQYL